MFRLIAIICLLLISLLAVFPAPAYPLWLLAVIVQSFPWIFAAIVLLLLITGGYGGRYGLVNALASALALVLYISPVIRAYTTSRGLGPKLELAFRVIELHGDSADADRINKGKAQMTAAQKSA